MTAFTPEALQTWYRDVAGAREPFDMVRRDQVKVGDLIHSSHSGKRRVIDARTDGRPPGTTYLTLEGVTHGPEAYPGDSFIPRYPNVTWRWHEEPEHGDYDDHGIPTLAGLDAESGDPYARCHLWPCENRLGWSLHEDDEYPHRSGMTWTMYLEVTEPGDERPAFFCEDCGGWLERTSGRTVAVETGR